MAQNLNTPKVTTLTVKSVEITGIFVDYENNRTIIQYITFLENGSPFQRGVLEEEGTTILNNTAVYARVIDKIEAE